MQKYEIDVLHDHTLFFEFGMARQLPVWVEPLGDPWSILHLGPGEKVIASDDVIPCEWPAFDFEQADCLSAFGSGTIGAIVATHLLEHLADPRKLLREAGRVLAPGAPFNILVPHAHSVMYAQDLDHKTPFVLDSWKNLLDDSYYARGKHGFPFKLGFNAIMALKEGNVAVVTQLIKLTNEEAGQW